MLRDFLTFSSLERKGTLILIIMILVITGFNFYFSRQKPDEDPALEERYQKELLAFEQQLNRVGDSADTGQEEVRESLAVVPELFYFDPNEASAADLRRLGLNDRVIRTLLNYRKQGGHFYGKDDLKKIYGLSQADYSRLLPWIKIRGAKDDRFTDVKETRYNTLNMNLADSSDFESLPGIGPVLARRIVRYRSLLGGYYETRQLREVYGLSDSLYQLVVTCMIADTGLIRKIDLNAAQESDLARHPYIGKHYARGIIFYRSSVGKIRSLQELKANGLLPAENYEKLKKYLSI